MHSSPFLNFIWKIENLLISTVSFRHVLIWYLLNWMPRSVQPQIAFSMFLAILTSFERRFFLTDNGKCYFRLHFIFFCVCLTHFGPCFLLQVVVSATGCTLLAFRCVWHDFPYRIHLQDTVSATSGSTFLARLLSWRFCWACGFLWNSSPVQSFAVVLQCE